MGYPRLAWRGTLILMGGARKMPKKKAKPRGILPPPKCKAILLCDQTIIEAGTNKISIIGVFDGFTLVQVPGLTRPSTVFVQLIDGIGEHGIEVDVHDLQSGTVLARGGGIRIKWPDRPFKHNLLLPLPPLSVSHVGDYDLVILADNQEIDRQKFTVSVLLPPPEQQDQEEKSDG